MGRTVTVMVEFGLIVLFLLAPLFCLWQMQPARMERLGPNSWVGLRTQSTVRSETAWSAAHRQAWPVVRTGSAVAALGLVIAAATVLVVPDDERPLVAAVGVCANLLIWLGFLIWGLVVANAAAGRAKRP